MALSDDKPIGVGSLGFLKTILQSFFASKDAATQSANGLMTSSDKKRVDGGVTAYATCDTAAATADKVATTSDAFALIVGATVAVKFSNTNTYSAASGSPITLNVNSTGAKNIKYGNSANPTGTNTTAFGRADYVNLYLYDGASWVFMSSSADNNTTYSAITQAQINTGTATTARSISAKVAHDTIQDLAGGTLAVNRGGTGGTTQATARTNLDVYSKAEVDSKITSLDPMTQAEADAGTSTDQRSISPSVLSTSIGTKLEAWTPRAVFISDTDYELLTEAEKKNGAVYYVYTVEPPSHDSAAEWAANPSDLKYAALDIAANGTDSAYYAEFAQYMADDASFPVPLENVDSYTSVAEDKILQMRLVGINFKTKSAGGTAGLTFMAKNAHPKANAMNASGSGGGWPSMALRTEMNSGTFWNTLPTDWQNVIEEVTNTSYGPSGTQVTSSDKMWIPSWYELCGSDTSVNYQKTEDGPQFPWFASKGTTYSGVKSTLANMYLTNSGAQPSGLSGTYFWTRSVHTTTTSNFVRVGSDGSRSGIGPSNAHTVLPCFSL